MRAQVGDGHAICGLSGGVDSSVAAVLVARAIGDRLTCIFVNNGVLRKDEFAKVQKTMREELGLNVVAVDASERFLTKLAGVTDPEQKRKVIGNEFIAVFDDEATKIFEAEKSCGRRGRVAGAGDAVSGCDRVGECAWAFAHDQEPPQCGRAAGGHEAEAD